jgi:hypothetical protein
MPDALWLWMNAGSRDMVCENDPFFASSGIDTRVEEYLFFLSRRFAPAYAVRDGCCLSCFECHTESSSNRP